MKIKFSHVFYNKLTIILMQILLVFSPEFKIFPKYTWILAMLGVCSLLFGGISSKFGVIDISFCKMILLLTLTFSLSMFTLVINSSSDYSYLTFQIGTVLSILRVYLLIYFIKCAVKDEENATSVYIDTFNWACVIYVVFTLLFMLIPEFKKFWLTEIINSSNVDYYAYEYRYSLNGFAAFASSTVFSIATLTSAYSIVNGLYSKKIATHFLKYLFIVVGCFFYGRVCIIAIGISFVYLFMHLKDKRKGIKIIFSFIVLFIALLIMLNYFAEQIPAVKTWRDWAFAIIDQLFGKGEITDYSFTHMFEDMYFMPKFKTFLLGDGMYTTSKGGYYMNTDVGFMRPILYFGVFGCILNYCLTVFILICAYKRHRHNSAFMHMILLAFVVCAVLEMKGEAYHRFAVILLPLLYTGNYDNMVIRRKYNLE